MTEITLTGRQIKDLAEFALGVSIDTSECEFELESIVSIKEGSPLIEVKIDDEPCEASFVDRYTHIAWLTEYPDEGVVGLGPEASAT